MTCHLVGLRNLFPNSILPMLLLLLLFVAWLNTTIIIAIRLLKACTMPIWMWLMVWSLSLKYSNYFSNNVACVWVYFSSNIKLVALICSMDCTNNLLLFFCGFSHALMSRRVSHFHPYVSNISNCNLFNVYNVLCISFFVHRMWC